MEHSSSLRPEFLRRVVVVTLHTGATKMQTKILGCPSMHTQTSDLYCHCHTRRSPIVKGRTEKNAPLNGANVAQPNFGRQSRYSSRQLRLPQDKLFIGFESWCTYSRTNPVDSLIYFWFCYPRRCLSFVHIWICILPDMRTICWNQAVSPQSSLFCCCTTMHMVYP